MPEKTKRPPVSDAGADATELTTAAPIAYRSVSGGMRLLRLTVVGPSAGSTQLSRYPVEASGNWPEPAA